MRWGAALLALTLPAAAQDARTRMLGEEWIGADGNRRIAKVGLVLDQPWETDKELVRRLEINWRDFPYQKGPFPVPVGDEDIGVGLSVILDIDDTGIPRDCSGDVPSRRGAAYDDGACPHLLKYLRFYPALARDGTRKGGALRVKLFYSAGRIRSHTSGGSIPVPWQPTPKPLKPIDAAAIGFSAKDGLPANIGGVSGWLRVETDGSVSGCTLAAPTQIDRFDLGVCERLRAWRFQPAVDHAGKIVAADYYFGASRR